jgi:short-subunit dehydrogenase
MDYTNWTAVVTGSSSGMGMQFARTLAGRGANLVLVARDKKKLDALATELRAAHGVTVDVMPADLSSADALRKLSAALATRVPQVDLLVNDAGFGSNGNVAETSQDVLESELAVNVVAVAELTRAVLPAMLAHDRGVIINVASLAAYTSRPRHTIYSASKSFVLAFTQAVWGETIRTGVRVTALCPGPVNTGFFAVSKTTPPGAMMDPQVPVNVALEAIERRRPSVIVASPIMRIYTRVMRMLPTRLAIRLSK